MEFHGVFTMLTWVTHSPMYVVFIAHVFVFLIFKYFFLVSHKPFVCRKYTSICTTERPFFRVTSHIKTVHRATKTHQISRISCV